MSDPLPMGEKTLKEAKSFFEQVAGIFKHNNILFIAIFVLIFGSIMRFFDEQTTYYAQAYQGDDGIEQKLNSPLFEQEFGLFEQKNNQLTPNASGIVIKKTFKLKESSNFAQKLYEIVGDTPIKEMVPMISKRDQKVAAFLVGIAKKESSFGLASPSKDGQTCYNYWGYKGSAGRGVGMGYACFASPEEAVQVVGDRIEVLVNKDRSTPSRMVDTWKCGRSCAGDPGAPGWVSTVALYFEKIVG